MTTIAYKNGVLAADSLITAGGQRVGYKTKIFKIGPFLCGGAGISEDIERFRDWITGGLKGDSPFTKEAETNCFLIMPDGVRLMWTMSNTPARSQFPYFSLGSGGDFAAGAMALGATAEQAVKAAIINDVYSGGKVTVLRH